MGTLNYPLGSVLYEILALRPAYAAGDAQEIVNKVARGQCEVLGPPQSAKVSHLPGGRIPESADLHCIKGNILQALVMIKEAGQGTGSERDGRDRFRTGRENGGRLECRCDLNILCAFARTLRKSVPAIKASLP